MKLPAVPSSRKVSQVGAVSEERDLDNEEGREGTWSVLPPICSRRVQDLKGTREEYQQQRNINRFSELERTATYSASNCDESTHSWRLLENFASHILKATQIESCARTEFFVGVDLDDPVLSSQKAMERIRSLLPGDVIFVTIQPVKYGKICHIWNVLARKAKNEFIVLLGDDVEIMDEDWQLKVETEFQRISRESNLPYGAACIALNDLTFPGYPTFPVMHRWHIRHFGSILPRQFVNQGGDPYLFELYSRWNASSFIVNARLKNTVGGYSKARYRKHAINWPGIVLKTNIEKLKGYLAKDPTGICIDDVVPSYRLNNFGILMRFLNLRSSIQIYVRFWLVVDNPDIENVRIVRDLVQGMNEKQEDGNYFIFVLSYGENRGASFARNKGFNFSTAYWVLFLDDDVIPDEHILDAYAGALLRYPNSKVSVGLTEMPPSFNIWTEMLQASRVMLFFGIAEKRNPSTMGSDSEYYGSRLTSQSYSAVQRYISQDRGWRRY